MDEANRGALISFLSFYPSEKEILFNPLARLEIRGEEARSFRGHPTLYVKMQVHVHSVVEVGGQARRKRSGSRIMLAKPALSKLKAMQTFAKKRAAARKILNLNHEHSRYVRF